MEEKRLKIGFLGFDLIIKTKICYIQNIKIHEGQIISHWLKRRFGGLHLPNNNLAKHATYNAQQFNSRLSTSRVKIEPDDNLPPSINFSFVPFTVHDSGYIGCLKVRPEYLANDIDTVERDARNLSSIFAQYLGSINQLGFRVTFSDERLIVTTKEDSKVHCDVPTRITKILDYAQYGPPNEPNYIELKDTLQKIDKATTGLYDHSTPINIYIDLLHQLANNETVYNPLYDLSAGPNGEITGVELIALGTNSTPSEVESEFLQIKDLLPLIRSLCVEVYGIDQFEAIETYLGYDPNKPPEQQNLDLQKILSTKFYAKTMHQASLRPKYYSPLILSHQLNLSLEQLPCYTIISALNNSTGLNSVTLDEQEIPTGQPYHNSDGSIFYPRIRPLVCCSRYKDLDVSLETQKQTYNRPFGGSILFVRLSQPNINSLIRDTDRDCSELSAAINTAVLNCLMSDERLNEINWGSLRRFTDT